MPLASVQGKYPHLSNQSPPNRITPPPCIPTPQESTYFVTHRVKTRTAPVESAQLLCDQGNLRVRVSNLVPFVQDGVPPADPQE